MNGRLIRWEIGFNERRAPLLGNFHLSRVRGLLFSLDGPHGASAAWCFPPSPLDGCAARQSLILLRTRKNKQSVELWAFVAAAASENDNSAAAAADFLFITVTNGLH